MAFPLHCILLVIIPESGYTVRDNRIGGTPLPGTANGTEHAPRRGRIGLFLAIVCLLVALYLPVTVRLTSQWIDDPNYQHGILIPFVCAFIVWQRRAALRAAAPGGGELAGMILVLAAATMLVLGTAASEHFTQRISMPVMAAGIVLFLFGRKVATTLTLPLLLAFMMVPFPYIIYYKISFPMQLMSARLSTGVLELLNVSIIRKGNVLMLPNYTLEVVAACSGLRSLMTMVTLALIFTAFSGLSTVRRVILVASAVPIAITANTLRLVVTAVGAYKISPHFADGIAHTVSGLIVFISGLLLLFLTAGILKWIR
jgi:exosortase